MPTLRASCKRRCCARPAHSSGRSGGTTTRQVLAVAHHCGHWLSRVAHCLPPCVQQITHVEATDIDRQGYRWLQRTGKTPERPVDHIDPKPLKPRHCMGASGIAEECHRRHCAVLMKTLGATVTDVASPSAWNGANWDLVQAQVVACVRLGRATDTRCECLLFGLHWRGQGNGIMHSDSMRMSHAVAGVMPSFAMSNCRSNACLFAPCAPPDLGVCSEADGCGQPELACANACGPQPGQPGTPLAETARRRRAEGVCAHDGVMRGKGRARRRCGVVEGVQLGRESARARGASVPRRPGCRTCLNSKACLT